MITVNGIEIDFDVSRTKDAKQLEAARETIKAAGELLSKPEGRNYDTMTEVCIEAVAAVLGEDVPKTLGMNKEYWKECVLTFAEAMNKVTEHEEAVKAELAQFDISRLRRG